MNFCISTQMFLSQLTLKLSFGYFILNLRISHQIYGKILIERGIDRYINKTFVTRGLFGCIYILAEPFFFLWV